MAEYIEREAVLGKATWAGIHDAQGIDYGCAEIIFINDVAEIPTADVVEVVRCKDCEYWRNPRVSEYDGLVRGECWHEECGGVWENGYCSDGERRNDGK